MYVYLKDKKAKVTNDNLTPQNIIYIKFNVVFSFNE